MNLQEFANGEDINRVLEPLGLRRCLTGLWQ